MDILALIAVCVASGLFLFNGVADAHEVKLRNNCNKKITVFSLENGAGKQLSSWPVNVGQEISRQLPNAWAGRFYARYQDVGQLSGWPQPDSLAEIKFDGYMGLDFYDISLVDGFGVPLQMELIPGTFSRNNADARSCKALVCTADLIGRCPEELKLKQGNRVVACQSSCTKFGSAEYCCTGGHNKPETCPQNHYGRIFKNACPDAYSYAFDDATSTFTCRSAPGKSSGYNIKFCG